MSVITSLRVALRCGESVVNWSFAAICRLSSVLAITRRSIDTVSCSNHCQLMCLRKCSLLLLFRGCDANVQSCRVRLCKIINTSIYYVFITTRSYVVTPTPVRPSCSPLDGDERYDHPLLHVSQGSSMSQLLYRFWNRNPARIVPPGRLIGCSEHAQHDWPKDSTWRDRPIIWCLSVSVMQR